MPAPLDDLSALEALTTTRAIRRYTDEPVADADLAAMMFAATRAPTGSNRQNYRLLALTDGPRAVRAKSMLATAARALWNAKQETDGYQTGSGADPTSPKARMAASMQHYVDNFERIPLVVLPCMRRRHNSLIDGASIYPACQNLLVSARALGYGGVLTGWHGSITDELHELLDIPAEMEIAATITIGRPAGKHGPVRRRPLSELVFVDGWDESADWVVDPPGTAYTQAGPPTKR